MSYENVGQKVINLVSVTREDITRAKAWILKLTHGNTDTNVGQWISEQKVQERKEVDPESADIEEVLANVARGWSLRMAFYQALFELSSTADIVLTGNIGEWSPSIGCKNSRGGGAITTPKITCPAPGRFIRIPLPTGIPSDPDIFLEGVDCSNLHSGIHEAIEQALVCFRKGLYMPATAMLAAAAEATWTECGVAVAKKLGDSKLEALFADQYASISKKVSELRKALEPAKVLLKSASLTIAKVNDAEVWTTVLRDRRNALHWGKAKSVVADHSETASLLMGAPLHIGTLEAIRSSC
jgi:hypothetical protein